MTTHLSDTIRDLVEPALCEAGFALYDVECVGLGSALAHVRVLVERIEGGIDLDGVAQATRTVSDLLDAVDPIDGAYQLEVSSPGLERPLRTPAHFVRALGTTITVKTVAGVEGDRRIEGTLEHADTFPDGAVRLDGRTIAYGDIERARTVFAWGQAPKPTTSRTKKPVKEGAAR